MFSSFMPSNNQLKRAATIGKLGLLLGLAGCIEVALAAPEFAMVTCFDLCNGICNRFGSWESNNNCTGGTLTGNYNYNLSVDTGKATTVKVSEEGVSPVSLFSIKYSGGVMCECKPANGQEFADVVIPKRK